MACRHHGQKGRHCYVYSASFDPSLSLNVEDGGLAAQLSSEKGQYLISTTILYLLTLRNELRRISWSTSTSFHHTRSFITPGCRSPSVSEVEKGLLWISGQMFFSLILRTRICIFRQRWIQKQFVGIICCPSFTASAAFLRFVLSRCGGKKNWTGSRRKLFID